MEYSYSLSMGKCGYRRLKNYKGCSIIKIVYYNDRDKVSLVSYEVKPLENENCLIGVYGKLNEAKNEIDDLLKWLNNRGKK